MWTKANIWKILRMLVVLLPLMFALTSCSNEGANQSDKAPETLAEEHSACWQASILTSIYEAMGSMSMGLYKDITQGALAVEMVGFALWFCIRLMKFVGAITPENAGEVWNEVFKKLFLCLFCGILASSTSGCLWVLNTIIFPIYNAFLDFAAQIVYMAGNEQKWDKVTVLGWTTQVEKAPLCQAAGGMAEATLSGFPESPMTMMNCMICMMNERLSIGTYISFRVMKVDEWEYVLNGIILLVVFMVLKLSFVFYLVDNIFKFAVMIVMMPILILFYPFQKKWAIFGVKTILSSAAFMMAISIMITVCMKALLSIIMEHQEIFNPANPEQHMRNSGGVFLAIMLLGFLVWSTIKVAKEITGSIVDAKIDDSFQQKLLGVSLIVLGWITGGLGAAFGKMKLVQQARTAYQKTAWARNLKKTRDTYNKYSHKLDEWAGRVEE